MRHWRSPGQDGQKWRLRIRGQGHRLFEERRQGPARAALPAGGQQARFPAVVQVHGGAWNNKDRTDGQNTALDLAAAGIVVLSIDFRNAPEAPYPASLQDINYAIRWLKVRAQRSSARARTGSAFTARRAAGIRRCWPRFAPTTSAIARCRLAEAAQVDAKVAFVVARAGPCSIRWSG